MSEGTKILYANAVGVAADLVNSLGVHFDRLEIAGSLRRKKKLVGDIELVGILRETKVGLFGFTETTPLEVIFELMGQLRYQPIKAGDKYIQFVCQGTPRLPHRPNVDLFLCTPETWGCIFLIRTGSVEFSRKMVTKVSRGGWCPDDMRFLDGRLLREGNLLDTPEETDVFRELGMAYIKPEYRNLK